MIRVAIAEDHPELRLALRLLLRKSKQIEVVGEVSNGQDVVACVRQHRPDVLVMDVSMPHLDGFALTRQIAGLSAGTRVILMSSQRDEWILEQALAAGAHGFVPKEGLVSSLLLAVETVYEGRQFFLK